MMRRIAIAYQVELAKALRYKPTYAGFFLVILGVLFTAVQRPPASDGHSDYAFIALATAQSLHIAGLIVLLVYACGLIAGEMRDGSIRCMLTRPLLRHEYVLAKLLHALTYAAVLIVVTGVGAWVIALWRGDLNGVTYGGVLLHTAGAMLAAYVIGAVFALVPLCAAAAWALFLSTLVPKPVVAALLAVGSWFVIDFVKYPLDIDVVWFSTYMESPWSVFVAQAEGLPAAWAPAIRNCCLSALPALALFTAGAAFSLRQRNLG